MLWVKAFHIIAVVCWFAVLFYLPRLFVYHAMAEDQVSKDRFKVMERKLYRGIGLPSMIATLVLGGWLSSFAWEYYSHAIWFWLKVVFVLLLVVYQHICGYYIKRFAADKPAPSHVFFRFFNEAPVIALIAIVILVVIKQPY